eukprot:g18709.t1
MFQTAEAVDGWTEFLEQPVTPDTPSPLTLSSLLSTNHFRGPYSSPRGSCVTTPALTPQSNASHKSVLSKSKRTTANGWTEFLEQPVTPDAPPPLTLSSPLSTNHFRGPGGSCVTPVLTSQSDASHKSVLGKRSPRGSCVTPVLTPQSDASRTSVLGERIWMAELDALVPTPSASPNGRLDSLLNFEPPCKRINGLPSPMSVEQKVLMDGRKDSSSNSVRFHSATPDFMNKVMAVSDTLIQKASLVKIAQVPTPIPVVEDSVDFQIADSYGAGAVPVQASSQAQQDYNLQAFLKHQKKLKRRRAKAQQALGGVPQPRGRPPKNKTWDRSTGRWMKAAAMVFVHPPVLTGEVFLAEAVATPFVAQAARVLPPQMQHMQQQMSQDLAQQQVSQRIMQQQRPQHIVQQRPQHIVQQRPQHIVQQQLPQPATIARPFSISPRYEMLEPVRTMPQEQSAIAVKDVASAPAQGPKAAAPVYGSSKTKFGSAGMSSSQATALAGLEKSLARPEDSMVTLSFTFKVPKDMAHNTKELLQSMDGFDCVGQAA